MPVHKRSRRKGPVVALCGDHRAIGNLHNWWEQVDCERCWGARTPNEGAECHVVGCRAVVVGFEGRLAVCADHKTEVKRDVE